MKTIEPIAYFRSPLKTKFGVPRQSGLVGELQGSIVFEPQYRDVESLRGLDEFSHIWLLWGFSANRHESAGATVRPPLLGGNERVGVFASRSPYRPNGLGLSSVHIESIERDTKDGPVIHVSGADLMDGTPIYDIKPYLPYVDCHADARGGFTERKKWKTLRVVFPDNLKSKVDGGQMDALLKILSLDPRPHYHDDAERVYGMPFGGDDIRFTVADDVLTVVEICPSASPRR